MSQLRQNKSTLEKLGVQISIISFDSDALARHYVVDSQLPWPMLEDTSHQLYLAYGMQRGSLWSVYGLPSIARYLAAMFRGYMPGKPGKDWRALGGDVLIDPQGVVRLLHISSDPHDRPSVDSLFAAIEPERIAQ